MIECKICGKELKSLKSLSSHVKGHKITSREYYDLYVKKEGDGVCEVCGGETNFVRFRIGYSNTCSQKCSTKLRGIKNQIKYNIDNNIFETPKCECGIELKFRGEVKGYQKFCSIKCAKNSITTKEKYRQTCLEKYGVDNILKYKKVKEKIVKKTKIAKIKNNKIGYKNNKPLFKFYNEKFNWFEETRESKDGYLEIKCKKCNKYFIPTRNQIDNRLQSIKSELRENNFYCSDECKSSCSIFGKQLYREGMNPNINRPYQSEWREEVLKQANYKCERCGSVNNLVAHHIKPVKTHPLLQADVDNGVCLCDECHSKTHVDECSTENLRKLIC